MACARNWLKLEAYLQSFEDGLQLNTLRLDTAACTRDEMRGAAQHERRASKPAVDSVKAGAVVLLRLVNGFDQFVHAPLVNAHRGHFVLKLGKVRAHTGKFFTHHLSSARASASLGEDLLSLFGQEAQIDVVFVGHLLPCPLANQIQCQCRASQ